MDVDSPNPNPRKRLSGRFPSVPLPTKAQDPRLVGIPRQSTDSQSSNAQQTHPTTPAKPTFIQRPAGDSLPHVPPLSIPDSAPGPTSTEKQSAPSHQGALFISDLVNSLIKVNQSEEKKERLEKEIISISKNLQRAKQSPQYPSVITLFQQQLDAAKDELANHVKSITQHRSLSNQAQDKINSTLRQSKPQPQIEKITERVASLESTVEGIVQGHCPTAGSEDSNKGNAEIGTVQVDTQGQDIAELKGRLHEVQQALNNPKGLDHALEYIKKIANSVADQSRRNGVFTSQISSLEDEVKAADKKLDDKVVAVKQMVDTVEEERNISNKQLEIDISDLGWKLKNTNEQLEVKFSAIESDLRSLNDKQHDLNNSASTQVSQIEIELQAQMRQATEQITAQENHLASLITQQKNGGTGGQFSSERTPTPHSGILTRVVSLEKKIQSHAELLTNIKKLHQDVDVMRLSELDTLRRKHELRQNTLEEKYDDTSQKVEGLATKTEEMFKKQTTLVTSVHQFKLSLPGHLEQLRTYLKSGLDGFETRLTPLSDLAETVKNCKGTIEAHSTAIRSLEQRWNNIHSADLVSLMARAMQEMYPSIDQLSQQLTAYRAEIETRISALKTDADAFKAETKVFKEDTNRFKADTEKAQADARNAQDSAAQAAQVSPEQLQTLGQLPTLLQQVKHLFDKLVPIETLINEHSVELQKNLEQRSELHNRITAQDDTIGGIAQKADEQVEELETITQHTRHIDPLINQLNAHISQLQEVRQEIDKLNKAARVSSTDTITDLDRLQRRLQDLENRNTTEDTGLDEVRKRLKVLEGQITAENAGLDALRTQLKDLEGRNSIEDQDLDELWTQLKAFEDWKPPVSLEEFIELRDKVNMYIKRLRNAEDTFKALGAATTNLDFNEEPTSNALDKPMEQRIHGQETPPFQPNNRLFTPRPVATPSTVPKGPTLGGYPIQLNGKGQTDNFTTSVSRSNYPVMHAPQPSHTLSGPSNSHPSPYSGKSAEPRQVQNLKGRRRVSSVTDSDDEINTTESSSVVESSPAPSSSAPASFVPGLSKKDKKKAKKRAEQAQENSKAPNRTAKKRKRTKQDE
ncbi:hypothetical protein PENVUL_c091G05288 [Penicillium vulpinum]|uniref:Uncharacterized protein n=2 Tax=Penicillium vulpinum TaxID=29845 RepID=A0A1V6R596_9EURO|nr:hypothetical protein PENVUL_c091G05288 [Penicillium vulpinum]